MKFWIQVALFLGYSFHFARALRKAIARESLRLFGVVVTLLIGSLGWWLYYAAGTYSEIFKWIR